MTILREDELSTIVDSLSLAIRFYEMMEGSYRRSHSGRLADEQREKIARAGLLRMKLRGGTSEDETQSASFGTTV